MIVPRQTPPPASFFDKHVKIAAVVGPKAGIIVNLCAVRYVPLSMACEIKCYANYAQLSSSIACDESVRNVLQHHEGELYVLCVEARHSEPSFLYYIVDPSQNQRMARYLNGTDSPLHDLVELLRFHPGFMLAPELREAKTRYDETNAK